MGERGFSDNAIMVLEALHSILSHDARLIISRKNMAIKVDMRKAHDQVS